MVDYVKDNFLLGRAFADLEDLNSQARAWLDNTAHARVHATTGHRLADLLESERPQWRALESIRPYTFIERHPRKVAKESMVSFCASRYSVPPAYVGREVTVELSGDQGTVIIHSGDAIVAEHRAASKPGESLTHKEHLDELWKLALQRSPAPLPNWRMTFDHTVAATPSWIAISNWSICPPSHLKAQSRQWRCHHEHSLRSQSRHWPGASGVEGCSSAPGSNGPAGRRW
jgi:hypothetical protein